MRQVFVLSMHETFYVGALICFVALGFSFLMQNPGRRTAQAADRVREASVHPAAADYRLPRLGEQSTRGNQA